MLILYADNPQAIEIQASRDDLEQLFAVLVSGKGQIDCGGEALEIKPYSGQLRSLTVNTLQGAQATAAMKGDQLVIEGDMRALASIAQVVDNFKNQWSESEHLHLEYYDGHTFLSEKSIPLILTYL
jgi:ubiquinone biosynthesis protein UbiJ